MEPNGYNRFLPNTRTGFYRGGCKHSEETKHLISIKTQEGMKKINLNGKNNPMYGKSNYDIWLLKYGKELADKMQAERNKKQSNNMLGKNKGKKRKKIKCPHCYKEIPANVYSRCHGNKCKFNHHF